MAYVDQGMKAKIAPVIREICKKYGVKGTLSVRNHSTLTLTVTEGSIDFFENHNRLGRQRGDDWFREQRDHMQVNTYWCHAHFDGVARDFLAEAVAALKGPDFFDHSDIQSDYFHVSHYIGINLGKWNKPYIFVK